MTSIFFTVRENALQVYLRSAWGISCVSWFSCFLSRTQSGCILPHSLLLPQGHSGTCLDVPDGLDKMNE